MKISIIGTGYVGLVTGVCLAEIGHKVICLDLNQHKIEMLKKGISPIFEPGLEELLNKNIRAKTIEFTDEPEYAVKNSPVIMIAVGTPPLGNGDIDMSQVYDAASDIGKYINGYKLVVNKSTVPVGTAEKVASIIRENAKHKPDVKFDVVSNPEFLREGSAVKDTFSGDRIVIGSRSKTATAKMKKLYEPLGLSYFITNPESAEMIKYSSNAFLATKISFINEIANLCEKVGADINDVAAGMGLDKRIGRSFLNAGIGYGGSCFPKDVSGLIKLGEKAGYEFKILKQVIDVNKVQRVRPVKLLKELLPGLQGKNIALMGLSFKPGTDDIREAPSLYIIEALLEQGAHIKAYDPAAMENVRKIFGGSITLCSNPYEAAQGCDALILLTEWPEFKELNFKKIRAAMQGRIIIDGRNFLDVSRMLELKLEYYPVGIGTIKRSNKKVQEVSRKAALFGLNRPAAATVSI